MARQVTRMLAVALVVAGGACAEKSATGPSTVDTSGVLTGAFATTPMGFDQTQSSFDVSGGTASWSMHDRFGGGGFMGGGLGPLFMAGTFGAGFGHGRFGDDIFAGTCAFNSGSGRVECAPITFGGITITRSVAFTDAAGHAQQAFDSLTNAIDTRVTVKGTITHRDSDVTTFDNASDRSVAGLLKGSKQRTINGTSGGVETTTGKDTAGAFTATRTIGDTTKNVVVPVPTTMMFFTFPTAGTIIREMNASLARPGKTTLTASRREVITYNGSDTATVVITQNGSTKNCKLPLPRGHLVCQ